MFDETMTVAPALTPNQWAHVAGGPWADIDTSFYFERGGHLVNGANGQSEDPAILMALANAGRNDADPGKVTWAMVDDLREGAADVRHLADLSPYNEATVRAYGEIIRRLYRHAAALAALLPPRA